MTNREKFVESLFNKKNNYKCYNVVTDYNNRDFIEYFCHNDTPGKNYIYKLSKDTITMVSLFENKIIAIIKYSKETNLMNAVCAASSEYAQYQATLKNSNNIDIDNINGDYDDYHQYNDYAGDQYSEESRPKFQYIVKNEDQPSKIEFIEEFIIPLTRSIVSKETVIEGKVKKSKPNPDSPSFYSEEGCLNEAYNIIDIDIT